MLRLPIAFVVGAEGHRPAGAPPEAWPLPTVVPRHLSNPAGQFQQHTCVVST